MVETSKKKKKKGKNSFNKDDVNIFVENSIKNHLRIYKIALFAFVSGIGIFVVLGLISRGQQFEIIAKTIYPPDHIYKDIEPIVSKAIWKTVTSGTIENYNNFVSKDEFYDALTKYHTQLVRTFLIPNREPLVVAREILRVGGIPEDVRILMGGSHIEGKATARCYKTFKNNELQAILVIPQKLERRDYSWFDCCFGWPSLSLTIEYQGRQLENVNLVGVRRNGKTNQLIILVTLQVAEQLNLPNWQSYESNSYGKIWISKAGGFSKSFSPGAVPSQHYASITDLTQTKDTRDNAKVIHTPSQLAASAKIDKVSENTDSNVTKSLATVSSVESDLDIAMALYEQGGYADSLEMVNTIISTDSTAAISETGLLRGNCLFKLKEYDEAIMQYQRILSGKPKGSYAATAMLKQGQAFECLNDLDTAKVIYKKLILKYSSSPEASAAKEKLDFMNKNNAAKAKRNSFQLLENLKINNVSSKLDSIAIKTSVEDSPIESDFDIAITFYEQNDYIGSLKMLNTIISANSTAAFSKAGLLRGNCLFKLKEYDEAIVQYQRIVSGNPKGSYAAAAILKQAISFERLSDIEVAKVLYKKLIKKFATSTEANIAKEKLELLKTL